MQEQDLLQELPMGLLKWYDFQKGENALFVTGGAKEFEALADMLRECSLNVDCMSLSELDESMQEDSDSIDDENREDNIRTRTYRYIVMVGALEYSRKPESVLQKLCHMLRPSGKLFLGTDNRLGIRYFCGDRDRFTGRNFDSIENYAKIITIERKNMEGRAYAKAELTEFLKKAGFNKWRFYSVFPALNRPQALYGENYVPEENLDVRIAPQYYSPDTIFLEEEKLYSSLVQNGLLHNMANGYLIECTIDEQPVEINQVTVSMDRGKKDALATIIYENGNVIKRALYSEGQEKLQCLAENMEDLRSHGISVVDGRLEESSYIMSYVNGIIATDYFRNLLIEDRESFLEELDRFWELIQKSSEQVPYEKVDWEHFDPEWKKRKKDDPNKDKWKKIAFGTQEEQKNLGVILKRGYIDLVSLNCFFVDGEFVFFDQEFYIPNLPAKAILMRTIDFIYVENRQLEAYLPQENLLKRYSLEQYYDLWGNFAAMFLADLRNEDSLYRYHQSCRVNAGTVNANRQRMNCSVNEYEKLFRNIFKGTEGRQIYLFGSAQFAIQFLSQFGKDYEIAGIFDNNHSKWGKELSGIKIMPPNYLESLQVGTYKVIVCIKNYMPVIKQLQELGVRDYAVYDSSLEYPRKMPLQIQKNDNNSIAPKKYHVGYISGVFDLFHIGHLNMFKRAKEQCDYLIVGVVTDESVVRDKKTMPYIPFEERIEIVRSCSYVDEAVEIPLEDGSSDEAYRRYQFDVQFAGSDYADSPWWQAKREEFQKKGSDIVFFPYTESTSSTKLKSLIEKKLL